MQNHIDVDRTKAEMLALREKLLAEKDKNFECDLQFDVSGTLDTYTSYRIRLAEIDVKLEGLDVIEKALADHEIVLQREMKALKAREAQRKKKIADLLDEIYGIEPGPQQSKLLAEVAALLV